MPICVPTCVFTAVGQPGNSYFVEVVIHSEYVGNLAQAGVTETETDVQGGKMVQQAAAAAPALRRGEPGTTFLTAMSRGLQHAAKLAAPLVVPLAEKAILALLA